MNDKIADYLIVELNGGLFGERVTPQMEVVIRAAMKKCVPLMQVPKSDAQSNTYVGQVTGGHVAGNQVFVSLDTEPPKQLWTNGARVEIRAAGSVPAEPVRHEMRMSFNGQEDQWTTVSKDVYNRFSANPDAGDGFRAEVRALAVIPA